MLVVFDIDGTLTRTNALDSAAFEQAFLDTFAAPLPSADWSVYSHVTDASIAREAARQVLGRDPREEQIAEMHRHFIELLEPRLVDEPELAVRGARQALERLRKDGHSLSVATGAWRASALLKLSTAGLLDLRIPLASSDDAVTREEILAIAIERGGGGCAVYVGDGLWDVRAAAAVSMGFVGMDCDGTGVLTRAGVAACLRSYEDYDLFAAMLRDALTASLPHHLLDGRGGA